jgi:hypothetical protein
VARVERLAGAEAHRQVQAEHLLAKPPQRRDADLVGAVRVRPHPHQVRRVRELERHLGERRLVEHLHHTHADRVERRRERAAADLVGDVLGDRVGLEQREERLLDGEVARVARHIDVGVAGDLTRRGVGLEEAALVGGDVRRERDQVVVAARRAAGVADLARVDLGHDLAEVAVDAALGELALDDGSFWQNTFVNGKEKWNSDQLDEDSLPIVLAWWLGRRGGTDWAHVQKAADCVVANGPDSDQERCENQSGYSPNTIAAEIAGLICAADIARAKATTRGRRATRPSPTTGAAWSTAGRRRATASTRRSRTTCG